MPDSLNTLLGVPFVVAVWWAIYQLIRIVPATLNVLASRLRRH